MKKFISIIVLVFLIASCTGVDPVGWNNAMIGHYNQVVDEIENFEESISLDVVGNAESNARIAAKGNQILSDIKINVLQIQESQLPVGGEEYQKALISFLESINDQIEIGLAFTRLGADTPQSEIEAFADQYDEASHASKRKSEALRAAQQKFMETVNK